MKKTIAIVGTLDTKGQEFEFLKKEIAKVLDKSHKLVGKVSRNWWQSAIEERLWG